MQKIPQILLDYFNKFHNKELNETITNFKVNYENLEYDFEIWIDSFDIDKPKNNFTNVSILNLISFMYDKLNPVYNFYDFFSGKLRISDFYSEEYTYEKEDKLIKSYSQAILDFSGYKKDNFDFIENTTIDVDQYGNVDIICVDRKSIRQKLEYYVYKFLPKEYFSCFEELPKTYSEATEKLNLLEQLKTIDFSSLKEEQQKELKLVLYYQKLKLEWYHKTVMINHLNE
jgi:hypothetical protein